MAGETVTVVSPEGTAQAVPADAVPGLEARGYRVESGAEEAARVVDRTLEAEYGDAGDVVQTGVEALARGATFGASDFLAGDLIGDEAVLMRRAVNPRTALAGELTGAIAPALLSGGQSTLGSLARLTPRGLAAAKAGQWISSAGTRGAALARGIAYETTESAGEMALNYLARRSLERGDVKAEDLARAALRGAALGVASGTLTGALAKLPARAGGVADDLASGATPVRASDQSVDDAARAAFGRKAEAAGDDLVSTADLAGRKAEVRSLEAHRELLADVQSRSRRDFLAEVDEVMQSPGVRLGLEQADREILERALVARARGAAQAGSEALEWSKRYGRKFRDVKGDTTYTRALGRVSRDLDDEGATKLAALDDAMDGLDNELAAVRAAASEAEQVASAAGPDALLAAAPGIGARIKAAVQQARSSGVMQTALTVAGAAEAANQIGLPVPTVSGMLGGGAIGKAVGLFLEAKAARGAVGKLLPSLAGGTPLARAVALAGKHREKLATAIGAGIQVAAAPARRIVGKSPRTVAKVWDRTQADDMRQRVAATVTALPMPLAEQALYQAERTISYLDRNAPQNPMAGTPWASTWKPDPHAASDWNRRFDAATDPDAALDQVFETPFASLEVEALREVHPDLFAEVQAQLAALEAPAIAKMRPVMREALGQAFGVPLTVAQVPGYMDPVPAPGMPQPDPRFARPSTASRSPLVTGEEVPL